MKNKGLIAGIIGAGILAGVLSTTAYAKSRRSIPEGVEAVTPFDIKKYMGTWYEIARFDFKFERDLSHVTATYSLNEDGSVKVINRGFNTKENEWKEAKGKAVFVGDENTGMLKVSFFGPFYSGYNVVAIDDDYQYAMIFGKNLDYLWLLSRTKTMPGKVKNDFLQQAAKVGYDISALIWTVQE